jgi:hypothetical protein
MATSKKTTKGIANQIEKLADEHSKEAAKQKAEFTNFGSASSENAIGSKTTKGWLESVVEKGKVTHFWQED